MLILFQPKHGRDRGHDKASGHKKRPDDHKSWGDHHPAVKRPYSSSNTLDHNNERSRDGTSSNGPRYGGSSGAHPHPGGFRNVLGGGSRESSRDGMAAGSSPADRWQHSSPLNREEPYRNR